MCSSIGGFDHQQQRHEEAPEDFSIYGLRQLFRTNKWQAHDIAISSDSNLYRAYENEVDYAHALFKYKGQGALDKSIGQCLL